MPLVPAEIRKIEAIEAVDLGIDLDDPGRAAFDHAV